MKIIENISDQGISYINEAGENFFVDFKKCNANWIAYRKKTENLSHESVETIKKNDKCIGQRNISSNPPFIEFFTFPKFTRFEFNKTDNDNDIEKKFNEFKNNITLAGWTTIDLS